ncbi:MAG: hypothetical protein RLZ98_2680 [Pseudomonadota bacterium]|jgi:alkylation response protein AidB-like acyl-CoA dehydrogenase
MNYSPPVSDIMTALKSAAGMHELIDRGLFDGLDIETVEAILTEAGRFAAERLAPLNEPGDGAGARLDGGNVTTAPGWQAAYDAFREAGWNALPGPSQYGGQGLPSVLSMAVSELWNGANLAFGLCPLLTQGAINALNAEGSEALKSVYLARMVAGEWTGTMNLTEPQAGSDLGAIRTRAEPAGDGTYRIFGTKIFITYGEHDLTENIVHMVLARLPDALEGTRGISLFLVPKYLVNTDGTLGSRNDVHCTGLEQKLGIHASPTCTMTYGDNGGAVGYLVGEPHRGLATMFIMMNEARLAVGVQGVAIAERATQRALAYARERRQGRVPGSSTATGMDPIIGHPDIRRQLLTMRALTGAARAICLATAAAADMSHHLPEVEDRVAAAQKAALLTPVAKAFSTDIGCEVASLGIQVHGGMGFIEETGAAQHFRDARILPIYEGTNGIQAIDLVVRKLPLENGAVVGAYLDELSHVVGVLSKAKQVHITSLEPALDEALENLRAATAWLLQKLASDRATALAGATPYLRAFALTAGSIYLARAAHDRAEEGGGSDVAQLATFFAGNLLPTVPALVRTVVEGGDSVLACSRWLDDGSGL